MARKPSLLKNSSGAVIGWVMAIALMGATLLTVAPRLFMQSRKTTIDDDTTFQLQLLASDLKELGKYLMLYERVFYTADPLSLDADIKNLWTYKLEEVDAAGNQPNYVACGGLDGTFTYMGKNKIGTPPKEVFCPFYLRISSIGTDMMEAMLMNKWSTGSTKLSAMTKTAEGYRIDLDMTPTLTAQLDPAAIPANHFIALNDGQEIFRSLAALKPTATLSFEILSANAGFKPVLSERYIRITSRIDFKAKASFRASRVEDSETVVMYLSTPREFGVFMPFPVTVSGAETSSFTSSVGLTPSGHVYGRTYFNGNVDAAGLNALPTFHEAAVFSGGFNAIVPTIADLPALKAHFNKGLITDFSFERFLSEGTQAIGGAGTRKVNNDTGLKRTPAGALPTFGNSMLDYISHNMNTTCWNSKGTLDPSTTPQLQLVAAAGTPFAGNQDPSCVDPSRTRDTVLHGTGFRELVIKSPYAFVISPVGNISATQATTIAGLLMGGYLQLPGASSIYSISNIYAGLPGISNAAELSNYNEGASSAYEGVSKSLMNLPTVFESKTGATE